MSAGRDELLRKATMAEEAAQMSGWLRAPVQPQQKLPSLQPASLQPPSLNPTSPAQCKKPKNDG